MVFKKKFEVLNPYLANFSFSFIFMYKFRWPNLHEFPVSHSCRRPKTWSNSISESEILFPEYLAISSSLLDTVSDQLSVGIHLPVVSGILAHLGLTVGQIWGRSVLEYSSQVHYPYQLSQDIDHGAGFCPNWVLSVLEAGWFTILGNPQLRLEVWRG